MDPIDTLVRLSEGQHGLVTLRQAREVAGMDRRAARRLADSPHWQPVTDEVLRRRGAPTTTAQHLCAAVLDAGPGAVLSHLPAGWWWGLRGCSNDPAHVCRTSRSSRTGRLAVVHTVRVLPEEWVTVLDGIPVVRPELLALQLFAVAKEERAERLVETLWSMRLLSGASLQRFLDELGRSGRNGTAGLRRYLEPRGPSYVPTASGLEARVVQILREAGIELRPQVDSGGGHWTGRVDFRHAEVPFVLEVQSERYHRALIDAEADARRLAALRADGFVVAEVTDVDVWTRPRHVVETVRAGIQAARRLAAQRVSFGG